MNRLALALLASLSIAPMAGAAPCDPLRPLPPGFTETILHEFDTPVTLLLPLPDGRAVVGLGNGKAHVMAANGTLGAAFVDYMVVPWTQPSGNVIIVESEGGVIGGAVSPTFDEDGYFYLSHTTLVTSPTGRDMRITRFTIDPVALTAGEETVTLNIRDANQGTDYHSGGGISFGPDGMIYWGLGDDADVGKPQRTNSERGKILRLRPDGSAPEDNPFYAAGSTGNQNYIYALGLRNPFRNFWDTRRGRFMSTDTGQSRWEELNIIERGKNYGWSLIEGPLSDTPGVTPPANYGPDFFAYPHSYGDITGIAIVGSTVYEGNMFPEEYKGDYFAVEWGSFDRPGKIFRLHLDEAGDLQQTTIFHSGTPFGFGDIAVESNGAVLFSIANMIFRPPIGQIRRITYTQPDEAPTAMIQASVTEGEIPLFVQFTASVSDDNGTPAICWKFHDTTTTTSATAAKLYQTPGTFDVTLVAEDGFSSRGTETIQISVSQKVTLNLNGQLFDYSSGTPTALAGTVTLLQSDGVTPLVISGGPTIETESDGGFAGAFTNVVLTGPFVVADFASPGFRARRVTRPITSGTVTFSGDFGISASAVLGQIFTEGGASAPGADVYIQINAGGGLVPYQVPGGIDLTPPLVPAGYPWGVLAEDEGSYYLPVRTSDETRTFEISANLKPTIANHVAQSRSAPNPGANTDPLNIALPRLTSPNDCEDIFPTQSYTARFPDVQAVFNNHCIGCHGLVSPNAGLSLAEGFSFSSIVEVPSLESPTRKLIDISTTGDKAKVGFLMEKIRCSQPSFGSVMPPTARLGWQDIELIGTWARQNATFGGVPEVNLYASRTEASSPARIDFRGGAMGSNPPISFEWNFDDGSTKAGIAPTRLFVLQEGSQQFDVVVTARNSLGAVIGTKRQSITVTAPDPDPQNTDPIAVLPAQANVLPGATITLDGTGSSDSDGTIVAYGWDVGNDGTEEDVNGSGKLSWTFPSAGLFSVRLTVTDDKNAQSTVVALVAVGQGLPTPTPSPTPSISPTISISATASPTISTSPTFTESPTPTEVGVETPTATPTETGIITSTPTPTEVGVETPTATPTDPGATQSPSPSPIETLLPTATATTTPTLTLASPTMSATPTASATTELETPTATTTPSISATATAATTTATPSISATATPATASSTATATETTTPTLTATISPTSTTPSETPTATAASPTATATATATATDSPTVSPTATTVLSETIAQILGSGGTGEPALNDLNEDGVVDAADLIY